MNEEHERYMGDEPCTSQNQVIRYLMDNYADDEGRAMPREVARNIVEEDAEQIRKGIEIFRSNASYLGDQAMKGTVGWAWIPEPDDE